jgi:hypothetical protein
MAVTQNSGIAVGANRGHKVTKRELKQKPSYRKGVSIFTKKRLYIKDMVLYFKIE